MVVVVVVEEVVVVAVVVAAVTVHSPCSCAARNSTQDRQLHHLRPGPDQSIQVLRLKLVGVLCQ